MNPIDYATADRQRWILEVSTFPRREHIEAAAKKYGRPFKCGPSFVAREVMVKDGIEVREADKMERRL